MKRSGTLVFAGIQHELLKKHLFPGDGKEAAAILLCTRVGESAEKLLVTSTILVPYDQCHRSRDRLTWPGECLDQALEIAEHKNLSLILIHSHPGGFFGFSILDDESDQAVIPSLFLYRTNNPPDMRHGSAIMTPDGAIKARLYDRLYKQSAVELVAVYGDDIRFFWNSSKRQALRPMAFGAEMTKELGCLCAVVIGASGTGSITNEQLLRMGFGKIITVDFDRVERKNLNRILNTTLDDADQRRLKVDVFKAAASKIRPDTEVTPVANDLAVASVIHIAAEADVIFCCVDSESGRHISDKLARAMLMPLFDVGVSIPVRNPVRGKVISNICGRIDYVQPGGSTLYDRKVYTSESLQAEDLRKADLAAYEVRVKEGYMPGAGETAPSVISVNMRAASAVVQEFIARAYPYRIDGNRPFARTEFDLVSGEEVKYSEDHFTIGASDIELGRGLQSPMLGLPYLEDD